MHNVDDDLTSELLALSEKLQLAYKAAKAAEDRDLAQSLHNMGWTVAQAIARRARQLSAEAAS